MNTLLKVWLMAFLTISFNCTSKKTEKNSSHLMLPTDEFDSTEMLLEYISTQFYVEQDHGIYIIIPNPLEALQKNFNQIGYQSKRLGKVSYDDKGNISVDSVSVFVKKTEFNLQLQTVLRNWQ